MRTIIIAFSLFPLIVCAQKKNEVLYSCEDTVTGLWAVKNKKGEIVLPAKYDVIFNKRIDNNVIYLADERGVIAIDRNDSFLFKPYIFDNGPDEFHEGHARFEENGKVGFVDRSGIKVIPAKFDYVGWFEDGMAEYNVGGKMQPIYPGDDEHWAIKGGKWGFINYKGEVVIEAQFDEVYSFEKGYARMEENGKIGFINKKGIRVTPAKFDYVSWDFYDGMAEFNIGGKWEPSPREHEGKVIKDGKWGFINYKGEIVIEAKFDKVYPFENGKAEVVYNGAKTQINKKGKIIK